MRAKSLSDRPFAVVLLFSALVSAELTCSLESGMIYVAISILYEQYGDPVGVGWLLTAFTLTAAASKQEERGMKIGVIGLGSMGYGIAASLLRAGHEVHGQEPHPVLLAHAHHAHHVRMPQPRRRAFCGRGAGSA